MIEGNIGPFHDLINLAKLLCYLKGGHNDTISRSTGNSRSCDEASNFNPVNFFFFFGGGDCCGVGRAPMVFWFGSAYFIFKYDLVLFYPSW